MNDNDKNNINIKDTKKLKPFDLEKAKQGKSVCIRNGRQARIICFDRENEQPIVALIKGDEGEYIDTFFNNGHSISKTNKFPGDLMMLPEKKEGWVNVYNGTPIYDTKEEALNRASKFRGYIDTVKVSWEE